MATESKLLISQVQFNVNVLQTEDIMRDNYEITAVNSCNRCLRVKLNCTSELKVTAQCKSFRKYIEECSYVNGIRIFSPGRIRAITIKPLVFIQSKGPHVCVLRHNVWDRHCPYTAHSSVGKTISFTQHTVTREIERELHHFRVKSHCTYKQWKLDGKYMYPSAP